MKKPVVAILGRPNVGKSTLFNRIVRKREAIVDDTPGVTRDRLYSPTDWAGEEFEILDTGGYVPSSDDVFDQAIRQQVDYAINEAAVIIFLTDVTAGVTALDEEIAMLLQKSGNHVLLVVNKVDNDKREADLVAFYRLGLGEPIPVSAMSGRTIGDFLDKVTELLPKEKLKSNSGLESLKLAIVGRPNVGKSSYVNTLLGEEKLIVTDIPGTTRDAIDTRLRYKNRELVLVDTAGLRKRARVKENIEYFSSVRTMNALRKCDVAIVLIEAVEGITDQDKKIIESAALAGKGIVIGVNKWDLVKKETNTAREFEIEMQENVRELAYIPIMFISALTKQRVFRLLDMALSVSEERTRRLQTAELNRFIQSAVSRNFPASYGGKYVKINYMTQIKSNPPLFVLFTNEPKGIKKNYKNYLENQLREQFGFMGVPIRIQIRKKN
ncbi:MAG: ribosome biogenesis GTPase Der [Calditrichaeota bacterium]|nr:ribosome biogenesis GTPase Der [Calditrichota bacterium]